MSFTLLVHLWINLLVQKSWMDLGYLTMTIIVNKTASVSKIPMITLAPW